MRSVLLSSVITAASLFIFNRPDLFAQVRFVRGGESVADKFISFTALSNRGNIAAAGFLDGRIILWDANTGQGIAELDSCYSPYEYYVERRIFVNEEDSLVGWGSGAGDAGREVFFTWTGFGNSNKSNRKRVALGDDVYSADYSPRSKTWLIGTGILQSTNSFNKPGIYLVNAKSGRLEKEWHPTDRFSFEVRYAPGESWFAALPKTYYSFDTIQTVYKFSGPNFTVERKEQFKGSDPKAIPLRDGGILFAANFPCRIWQVSPDGHRKLVKLDQFQAIEDVVRDEKNDAYIVLAKQTEYNSYEWVQFDADWQIIGRKSISTLFRMNASGVDGLKARLMGKEDSVMATYSVTLSQPSPKLSLQLQTGHSQSIDEVIAHPSSSIAASNSRGEGKIKLWDLQSGFQLADIRTGYAEDLQFVPSKNWLSWREGGKILFFDLKSRAIVSEIEHEIFNDFAFAFAVAPDAKTFEVYLDKLHAIFDMATGAVIREQRHELGNVSRFRIIDNLGSKVVYNFSTKGDAIAVVDPKGRLLAKFTSPEIRKWWLKNDRKEIALLLSRGQRLHNEKLLILQLPGLQVKRTIPVGVSETIAPDAGFTKFVTAANDSLSIRYEGDERKGSSFLLPDEYFSSYDQLEWDASGQYIISPGSYDNGLRVFRNFWRNLGEKIQNPQSISIDSSGGQLYVSTDGGLTGISLRYLKKPVIIDSNGRNSKLVGVDQKGNVFYNSGQMVPNQFSVFRPNDSPANPRESGLPPLEHQAYNPSFNWLAGESGNMIHIFKLDHQGAPAWHDSVAGIRPFFANKREWMGYFSGDSNHINIIELPGKKPIGQISIKNSISYMLYGPGRVFSSDDRRILSTTYSGGSVYLVDRDSMSKKDFHLVHEITSVLASADTSGFFAGDITGNIHFVLFDNGRIKHTFYGHTEAIHSLAASGNRLYSTSKDGTIRIWDIETAALLTTLVIDESGNVLLVDEETNYYASSRRDPRSMAFVYQDKVVGFDQFDLLANRPDRVFGKIGLADPRYLSSVTEAINKRVGRAGGTMPVTNMPAVRVADINSLPLVVHERDLKITVSASDSTSLVARIHLSVNGVPLYGKSGFRPVKYAKSLRSDFVIPLGTGNNLVEVEAENAAGARSPKEIFRVDYEPAGETRAAKIYYVGVGVSRYKDSTHNLDYAAKDIRDIATILKTHYPGAIIDTLTNDNVTRENLLQLKKRLAQLDYDDKVIVSFSGHGLLDKKKDFYFATHAIDFKNPRAEGWSFEDMHWLLDSIPVRNKLLLVDACHSGEVDKGEPPVPIRRDSLVSKGARSTIEDDEPVVGLQNSFALMQELFADLGRNNGTIMITAAGGRQFALEGSQWKNGVFTYSLLRGLQEKKADSNGDGLITVGELRSFLFAEVQRLTNGRQQPTTRIENLVNDWTIWQ